MFCDTGKVRLHYEVSGEGHPLIMLHGNGEDISIFEKALPLLEKHFRVYRIDSRCHGESTDKVPLHYDLIADDTSFGITSSGLDNFVRHIVLGNLAPIVFFVIAQLFQKVCLR